MRSRKWLSFLACAGLALPSLAASETAAPVTHALRAERVELDTVALDGEFDEAVWGRAQPATGFRQRTPENGAPASERTEIRATYDELNLYFAVLCRDGDPGAIIADEQGRDADLWRNDSVRIILDTFHDFRSGYLFETNPQGARGDAAFTWSGLDSLNWNWDEIWDVRAKVTDLGWQAEVRIPFSSLRFHPGKTDPWGVTFVRRIRRKNEVVTWPFLSREHSVFRLSLAGELRGLEGIRHGRTVEVKPYLLAGVSRTPSLGEPETDESATAGLDVKFSLGPNLTADLTLNTDFSQTEVDTQMVNLTRFDLFFPEKREFFLESSEDFKFGRDEVVEPFFSRRIGLVEGEVVPILGGAKLSGKLGRYRLGALSIHTNQHTLSDGSRVPETNFSVLRLKRDVRERSSVGLLAVNREMFGHSCGESDCTDGVDNDEDGETDEDFYASFNRTYGVDADFQFLKSAFLRSFLSKTHTPGLDGNDYAGMLHGGWWSELWECYLSHIVIEENYNPEVGFVPRTGVRTYPYVAFNPQPNRRYVRDLYFSAETRYWADRGNDILSRDSRAGFSVTFQSGDWLSAAVYDHFERIREEDEYEIYPGIWITEGDYSFEEADLWFGSDSSRKVSTWLGVGKGSFYDGHRDMYYVSLQVVPGEHFLSFIEYERNEVRLPAGDFNIDLLIVRMSYSFTTRASLDGSFQFNSTTDDVTSNVRFRWIWREGSDLFVVYNERRDVERRTWERSFFPDERITDRSLVVKWTVQFNLGGG
ncbi:MAG: carbohydrate binding family 9 domain-containing protein [Acidobacteriota bacterium]|nr:MAG: carbohydrate binding family 9 domain-containing protein [Acidobacteriota bacterium]